MTSRTRLLVLSISTPVLAFAVIGGFLGRASAGVEDTYQHLRLFEDVVSLITNNYVEEVKPDHIMEGALRGLADGLDPDSAYLTPDEVRAFDAGIKTTGTVGIDLTRQYYLRVVAVRDGSAAAKAGLTTGDYIRAIDGTSTRDLSTFGGNRRLLGEVGSKVTLTVLRGSAAETHEVVLVREKEASSTVTTRLAAPGVGYVRVPAFTAKTADELKTQIAKLKDQAATQLIIDLRRTAEGSLDAGVAAARLFVPSGTLVIREGRDEKREPVTAGTGDGSITQPVVILTTTGTAGAAELFTAALVGNKRAETVGERTLGRAALQKLIRLPEGAGFLLSWARYLNPAGDSIQGKGVEPGTEVEDPEVEFGSAPSSNDPIFEKALERLTLKAAA